MLINGPYQQKHSPDAFRRVRLSAARAISNKQTYPGVLRICAGSHHFVRLCHLRCCERASSSGHFGTMIQLLVANCQSWWLVFERLRPSNYNPETIEATATKVSFTTQSEPCPMVHLLWAVAVMIPAILVLVSQNGVTRYRVDAKSG